MSNTTHNQRIDFGFASCAQIARKNNVLQNCPNCSNPKLACNFSKTGYNEHVSDSRCGFSHPCRACGRREHRSDNSLLPRLLFSTRLTEHAQNTRDHDTGGHTEDHTGNHPTGDHDTGDHDTPDHDTGDRGSILKSRQMHTGMNRRVLPSTTD